MTMQTARFEPLDREIGRLVLGTTWFDPVDQGAAFDNIDVFVGLGGTVIDTAENYGRGDSETVIGRWLAAAPGRRDQVLILSKGAHPYDGRNRVTPEAIGADLAGSLERLGVDQIDIYLLHRDDESVPVGPIVEALNEHQAAGRIRTFGASNWTTARLDEAAAYAADQGLHPFTSSSVQFALAIPRAEPWPLCISGRDPQSTAWYRQTRMPLFAWSSQASGFFAGTDDDRSDAELERVYGSEANRDRRRRARDLGDRLGFDPAQIALAWVTAQPFWIFPVVRARRAEHLEASVAAMDIALDPATRAWLDRG
jgi:aryl-alcohol dehydrogenase-like predicted oxidoreductase